MLDLSRFYKERLYSDIETKGFWDKVQSISDVHCICNVVVDPITGGDVVLLFHDRPDFDNSEVYDKYDDVTHTIPPRAGTLKEGFDFWFKVGQSGGRLSIHNCRTFDKPITGKVKPDCVIPFNCWEDTFVQSKVQWYDRPVPKGAKSGHGLEGYGIKFGIKKPPVKDWEIFTPYICFRVVEDCFIQKQTALYLDREAEQLKKLGIDMTQAILIENYYAELCWNQELHGALVDVPHMERCLEFLDKETTELASSIEPRLPMTLKKKASQKVGRKEISELLTGRSIADVKDSCGEVIKMYYKPSTNFTNKNTTTMYSGFNMSYGESPKFTKLAEMREWVKLNHPDTVFKDWAYEKSTTELPVLDNHACKHFNLEPTDTDILVGAHTRVYWETSRMTQHEVVKGFLIREGITWAKEWNFKKKDKQMVRAEFDMEVRYPPNALPEHQIVYQIKKGEPIVSSPKFGESEYEQLGEDAEMGRDIAKYNTYMHRRRFISNPKDPDEKGVMAYVREDGRVPCGLGNFMTSTGRSNQRVIVNLPSIKALFGKEMRQIVIAPEGKKLVGADQKSSQLSIAAFISNNTEYYTAVASGQQTIDGEHGEKIYLGESAHCVNARNFGLVTHDDWQRARDTQDHDLIAEISMMRDKYAKGLAFACIFGASGKKMGVMLKKDAQAGNDAKNRYLKEMGLDIVLDFVERCSVQFKHGGGFYIPIAYGYWLWCRSPHVGVNYFCQGLESLVQKLAVLNFNKKLKAKGWDSHTATILQVHDEQLIETPDEYAQEVGDMACESYTFAGKQIAKWYKENLWAFPAGGTPQIVPDFAGGADIGESYYECH
jgi:hypothetical protein